MAHPLPALLVVVVLGAGACSEEKAGDADAGTPAPPDASRCGPGGDQCGPDGAVPDGGLEPCVSCADGACLPAELGGGCAPLCAGSAACQTADVCAPVGRDPAGRLAGTCLGPRPSGRALAGACIEDADCASHACLERQCTHVCADAGDCFAGQSCRPIVRPQRAEGTVLACAYGPRASDVQVVTVPLGERSVRSDGVPARIDLAVPPDTVSVTFLAHEPGGPWVPLAFADLWDARDEPLFDLALLAEFVDQPERWIPIDTEEVIAMMVPNTTPDRIAFEPGHLAARVAVLDSEDTMATSAEVEVSALIKRAPPDLRGGVLDLNVFLVGVDLSVDDAPTDARLAEVLAEAERILGAAGISLGSITFAEVEGEAAHRLAVLDSSSGPDSELAELLRHSRGQAGLALNLFLVRQVAEGAGEGTISLGIAGGIPGPPGLHGTMHSGVAVSFDPAVVGSEPEVAAQVMAHEIAHFLGLFHTTEAARPCREGEGPTPTDPCAPFGGGDVLTDTTYGDGGNLMYFAAGGDDGQTYNVELTEGQAYVLSRSALLR